MSTKVISNGSKWYGEENDPIDVLWPLLEQHKLAEWLAPWIQKTTEDGQTKWHILGNFEGLSHVFQVDTDDPELGQRFEQAIEANLRKFPFAWERVTVSQLRVGDHVRVSYPGGASGAGTVYFVGKGYTAAKDSDGRSFKIKSGATIKKLATAARDGVE
jgi:hypothetical protein